MVGFTCVAAVGPLGQLGENNNLPWPPGSIRGDMNYFRNLTSSSINFTEEDIVLSSPSSAMSNVVIMGRKTWDSIPNKFRPLDSRLNIVITSSSNLEQEYPGVCKASSFDDALTQAQNHVSKTNGQIYVIGGASIYDTAIKHSSCEGVFLTEISGHMKDGDVFFPLDALRSSYSRHLINQFGFSITKDSIKKLEFDGEYFYENNFKYQFALYK